MNFKLTIEYDGSGYHGWQRQKNARTIQGEIEKALQTMTGSEISLAGSGRTDAGVHAYGQTANFRCETRLTPEIFQRGLNSLLAADIVICECCQVDDSFHARFDAKRKTYNYRILNSQIPAAIGRGYSWFIRRQLDHEAMQQAAARLVGTHDFKAFEGVGSPRSHTERTVFHCGFSGQDLLVFEIEANGFLRYMVRNIVGTLAEVGLGKIAPENIEEILVSKDRFQAGATAPPHGLFLMNVEYQETTGSKSTQYMLQPQL